LMDLQKRQEHMAVVVDEYGGAVGIVTIEDIGEEIVGSIDNEYESGEKLYKKIAAGRYLINGRMDMDSLSHLLATRFPEGNYETISGFIMDRLGKIPKRRERLEYSGITFIIENADQKSIKEIAVIFPVQIDKVSVKQ
jgi:putative hemolysin